MRLFIIFSFCISILLSFSSIAESKASLDCLKQTQAKDWDKAIIECTTASEQGSGASAAILGRIYDKGLGGHKDIQKAATWYDIAAKNKNKDAAYRLAELWLTPDTGLGYEPATAATYFELAYHNGHTKAGLVLAKMLRDGRYIPQNVNAAFRIYEKLSKKSRLAAYQTGKMLMSGQGTQIDAQKATSYYIIAANADLVDAQRDLGIAYWEGSGIAQSNEKAWLWLDIAAFKGDMEAAAKLNEISGQIPEDTAKKARDKARAWVKKHQKP
ncbi:MAG: tetratricopeptide repeat protein [Alphaproteobacteria bacterium]